MWLWFIGVELEQETSAPPPKKNPGSAPAVSQLFGFLRHDCFPLKESKNKVTTTIFFIATVDACVILN